MDHGHSDADRSRQSRGMSLRSIITLLLLMVLVPVVLVQAGIYWRWTQVRQDSEFDNNREFARAVAKAFDAHITDVVRTEMATGLAITSLDHFDRNKATTILTQCRNEYPSLYRMNWVTPEGEVIASTSSQALNIRIDQRQYYQEIRSGHDWVVSDLITSLATKEPIFVIARGIRDKYGKLLGIVVASVNPSALNVQAMNIERIEQGSFGIVDHSGQLVYRDPPMSIEPRYRNWGKQFPVVAQALKGKENVQVIYSPPDRNQCVLAAAPVRSIGWAVTAGRPELLVMAQVKAGIREDFGMLVAVSLVTLLVGLLVAGYMIAPLRRLQRDALSFGTGDLERRTIAGGPREVSDLAIAFNEMAETIQAQHEELTAQNEELQAQHEELAAQSEELATQNDELQQLSMELETERSFLMTVVDILPLPAYIQTIDHKLILANDACRSLFDEMDPSVWLQQYQLLAINTRVPIPLERWPSVIAQHGERPAPIEALLVMPNGKEYPVLKHAAPVIVGDKVTAVITILQDISALKAEDRAKDEFLAILSHELLTPVTSMLGWAQVAQDQVEKPEMMKQALTVIERNAIRQKRLVDDLLDISRIVHGKLVLTPETVDLWPLILHQVENAQQVAKKNGVTLNLSPSPGNLPVYVDPLRTSQAITNLLNNALKFTPAGGTVAVTATRNEQVVRLSVQDTGRGIPPEQIAAIFNPFRQLNRDEATGGLGLGLALVQGIINLQQGQVRVESPGLDQGSTFTIELPLASNIPESVGNKQDGNFVVS